MTEATRAAPDASVAPPSALAVAVKDATFAALVAFLLAIPLLAWRTMETQTSLGLLTRWPEVAMVTVAVFVGRLGLALLQAREVDRKSVV